MRVLVINYEFPPIGGGGSEVSANIARHLVRAGVEVFVLTAHYRGLPYEEVIDGYTVYRIPSFRQRPDRCSIKELFAFLFCNIYPSLTLARRLRPDIVHIHFAMPVGPLGYLIKKTCGIPYIITLHGGGIPGFFTSRKMALWYKLLLPFTKPIWREASAVVAVSQGLKELAARSYPEADISVIPNGIDCERFHPRGYDAAGKEKVVLIFVGRVAEQKGLKYLLKSLTHVMELTERPFELRIVGDGPLQDEMKALARSLGIREKVRFIGWVSQDEVVRQLREGDIFVLPSLIEGLSIAMLQAMACGLPVVATDTQGNNELVRPGENGLLVPVGDTQALARALFALIDDEALREAMGRRSRAIAARYDWDTISRAYLDLFHKVIDDRLSGGNR